MNTEEIWKPIEGWPYEVSNLGHVRRASDHQPVSIWPTPNGYSRVVLVRDRKDFRVHRLVAGAFLPEPIGPGPWQVNHINGIKTDNTLENLEWNTPSQNQLHALRTGLRRKPVFGSACSWAKLTDADVLEILRLYEAGAKQYELSAQFKVSFSMIGMIVNGRRWQHLTGGIRRGHRVAGSAHALSKLTEKDIPEIRRLQAEGVSMREIGRRYGVSSQTIRQIFTGKSWKQVPLAD